MGRPQAKRVRVNPLAPEAAAVCDRCGRWFQLNALRFQYEWSGTHLYNTGALVCTEGGCYDIPQEQFRTIILPPDPPPLPNARPPNFAYEEKTVRIIQYGGRPFESFAYPFADPPNNAGPQTIRSLQGGKIARILQLNTNYPAGVTSVPTFIVLPKPPPAPPGGGTQVFIPTVLTGI